MTYVIRVKQEFYGPSVKHSLLENPETGRALIFDTLAAAKKYIDDENDSISYYLEHNESSRPTYRAARADSLPEYLAQQL